MIALAAGDLDVVGKSEIVEPLVEFERGLADVLDVEAFVRIEIEDELVGHADLFDRGAPDVDLDHADLDQRGQAVEILDVEEFLVVLRIVRFQDRRAHAGHRVLLEEALALDAVRRAHQRQRPVDDELPHARPHQRVVVEQILLG